MKRAISLDEIAGFCDLMEDGIDGDNLCGEFQIVLVTNGERTFHLLAKSLYRDPYGAPTNIFTPLAKRLADEIGVAHFSVNLVVGSVTINGESVAVM